MANAGNIEGFIHYIAENLVLSIKIIIAGGNGTDIEEGVFVSKVKILE